MTKIIHDIITNEITEVPLSAAEIKKREDNQVILLKEFTKEQAEAKAKATARQAIADRLGLTADELQVLLG